MQSAGWKTTATSLWKSLRLSSSMRTAALAQQKTGLFLGLTRMVAGCAGGEFFRLPGGPIGIAVGLIGGGIIGAVGLQEHSFDKEFANDIRDAVTPGKAAVIAEVTEESEPSVDNRMAQLGGVVFQWTKSANKNR
jgi:uncharacterized membrane protein